MYVTVVLCSQAHRLAPMSRFLSVSADVKCIWVRPGQKADHCDTSEARAENPPPIMYLTISWYPSHTDILGKII